jgi:hypothetical protein
MKQLLIATAALSLIGGAAFARTNTASQSMGGTTPATSPGGMTPNAGASAPSSYTSDPGSNPASSTAMTPGANPASSMANASNEPAGSPPATYPVCTSKHEDRCVNRSQATRVASVRTHKMRAAPSPMTTTQETQPSGF